MPQTTEQDKMICAGQPTFANVRFLWQTKDLGKLKLGKACYVAKKSMLVLL